MVFSVAESKIILPDVGGKELANLLHGRFHGLSPCSFNMATLLPNCINVTVTECFAARRAASPPSGDR